MDSAAAEQTNLSAEIEAFDADPSNKAADAVAQQIITLSNQGRWDEVAVLSLQNVQEILEFLPSSFASEFLLLTAQAKGTVGDSEARDNLVDIATTWSAGLPEDAARSMSINIGYVLLRTEAPDQALTRLAQEMQDAEHGERAEDLMSLCNLGPNAFVQFAYFDQATQFYELCDSSEMIRHVSLPGRGVFWHNYALFLRDMGRFDLALSRHRRALNELAAEFGFPSVETVEAYDAMSQTLLAMGDLGGADAVADLAITYSNKLGRADTDAGHWRLVNNSAAVKRALRLPARAIDLDYAAYVWRRDNLGETHALTLASWMNYTLDLVELEQWDASKEQLRNLLHHQENGAPVPYSRTVLIHYFWYADARLKIANGERFKIPPLNELTQHNLPIELLAGTTDLVVGKALADNDHAAALNMAEWATGVMRDNLSEDHPLRFEMELLLAQVEADQNRASASTRLAEIELNLFNWTRRQALSGSYDASVASRSLADDLLLFMAQRAQSDPGFQPYFAQAIHRWKTLESPSDRVVDHVAASNAPAVLKDAMHDYGLASARFRETVRSNPVSDQIAALDVSLRENRDQLNAELSANDLPLLEPPLAPLPRSSANFPVKDGDVVIDMIMLRDWTTPDRSGWSRRFTLYAAVHRANMAPEVREIARLDFETDADVYGTLWRDLGDAMFAIPKDASRVFIAPDAMLFQMDLLEIRDLDDRRLGEVFDVFFLSDRSAYGDFDTQATLDADDRVTLAGGLYYSALAADDPKYLPGSLSEIQAIGQLTTALGAQTAQLQGFDATTDRVLREASTSEVLHLATHGFFDGTSPDPYSLQNAGLVLASASDPEVAYASDVIKWDLRNIELVVLSACLTGVGESTAIDAVRGLPLSLARAGASRSLLTLQEIPDQQTALIMERFYQYLTKDRLSYSEAFLETKRDIWGDRIPDVSPDVASAFVLYSH